MSDPNLPGSKPFDPTLPVVVLVHGAHNDHSVWHAQARTLQEAGYAVLAPDLPGHGTGAGPALRSVEAMAAWLLDLLASAGVRRAVFAGHSMGSLVALEAASRARDLVCGLALVGTAFPMRVSDTLLQTAYDDEPAAIEMVARWSHCAPELLDTTRRLMQAMSASNPQRLLHTDLSACNGYANGEAAAANVACPALLVVGTQDKMTPPRASARLAQLLGQASVVDVDAGHAMMAEASAAVGKALLDLADRAFHQARTPAVG